MVKTSLRYKVALELYAILSLFAAIIILYFNLSYLIGMNLFIAAVMIMGIFLIALIFFLNNLIKDVNSFKFVQDETRDDPNIVEIRGINKVTLELFSSVSSVMIISAIFIMGIARSGGFYSDVISIAFIIILLVPVMTLMKSLIFDFNLIFRNKKNKDNFIIRIINRRTLVFFVIVIVIIFSALASNRLVTSVTRLYDRSISTGEGTISDLSSNMYITSITGERIDIPGAPINKINIYIEAVSMDLNIKSIMVKYKNETSESKLNYGTGADELHFSYEGKFPGKGDAMLRIGDVGIITINLSSTKQELYSHDKANIQIITGNDKIISREIRAPELKGGSKITMYAIN